jgi:hypothetical protein
MAIRNLTAGKTRHLPVSDIDLQRMYAILQKIDPTLSLDVVSGGQPASGPGRTGSHRHDVDASGVAHTADVVFSRNGQVLLPGENKPLYTNFIQQASGSFPGIGHYPWGIHVGGGKPAFWGPDKTGATADPAFLAAYNAGRGGSGAQMSAAGAQPAFQAPLGDVVAPNVVQTTPVETSPLANVALGFLQKAEERRAKEAEEERERRTALFAPPPVVIPSTGLAGLYT